MSLNVESLLIDGKTRDWEPVGEGIKRQLLGYDDNLMLVRVSLGKNAVGPPHKHPHTQVGYVESGKFKIQVGDDTKVLEAGDSFYVPPNVVHSAVALEGGCLLDIFTPARKEFIK